MKIYNSNSSNALIQDLGPFKTKSANLSIKGKIKLEYETYSQPKTIGSQSIYGKNTNHGFLVTTSIQDRQNYSAQQSVAAIRVSEVIQAFCPAQNLVSVDRIVR